MILFNQRGRSKLAFDGVLNCPVCSGSDNYDPKKQSWRHDSYVGPYCIRYICKKCGCPVRYDFSNQITGKNLGFTKNHPYANIRG